MAVAMIHAWTSTPCPCAVLMRAWSGSKPAAIDSFTGRPERRQKQSPRRTTWATIAFAWAAFVAATSASISAWSLMPSPKASAQKARNWPAVVVTAPRGETSAGNWANKLARYQRTAASVVSFRLFPFLYARNGVLMPSLRVPLDRVKRPSMRCRKRGRTYSRRSVPSGDRPLHVPVDLTLIGVVAGGPEVSSAQWTPRRLHASSRAPLSSARSAMPSERTGPLVGPLLNSLVREGRRAAQDGGDPRRRSSDRDPSGDRSPGARGAHDATQIQTRRGRVSPGRSTRALCRGLRGTRQGAAPRRERTRAPHLAAFPRRVLRRACDLRGQGPARWHGRLRDPDERLPDRPRRLSGRLAAQ